ncbi:MAG: SDR family oxidoreductase [Sphingomonadales bacterium]|nr:SDR family oxidoreductase [Sphingomonadales bacterium]
MDFDGKTILVTGSTRGIGAAVVELFLQRGGAVIVHGREQKQVDGALAGMPKDTRVRGVAADLADRDQCKALARQVGELDVLVNSAGTFREAAIAETPLDLWNETIAVNVTAPWVLSQALLPALRRRQGVIVNVGSDAAILGYAGCVAYCAAKGALVGLTRALATELAPDVRAICVCPGPTETDMMQASVAAAPDPDAARRQWASYPLLGRVATPAEIAEAIVFAASPAARYLTGSVIMADGGTTAGKHV